MAAIVTVAILFSVIKVYTVGAALCNYPVELAGTVISTGGMYHRFEQTNWTRSDDVMLQCEFTDGNLYVSRITQDIGPDIIQCHQFIRITNTMYEVQDRTISSPGWQYPSGSVGDTSFCTAQVDKPYDFEVFIQPSNILSDFACPTNLRKLFYYMIKTGDEGEVTCQCDSMMNVCDDQTHIFFDYSRCSIPVVLSADATLRCIYSKQESSGQTYVILRRHDNIVIPPENGTLKYSTDAFACMVYKDYENDIMNATIVPLDQSQPRCRQLQTDYRIDNRLNGNHLQMTVALQCSDKAIADSVFDQRKLNCLACRHQMAVYVICLILAVTRML